MAGSHRVRGAARTIDFVAAVRAAHPNVVISIDTWRSAVARLAGAAGADLINDAWAAMIPTAAAAAEYGVGLALQPYRRADTQDGSASNGYADVVSDVISTVTSWRAAPWLLVSAAMAS